MVPLHTRASLVAEGFNMSNNNPVAPVKPIAVNINRVHEIAPWSRSTTYKLVAEGSLPARKLGRSTVVLLADVERFIANLEKVAP